MHAIIQLNNFKKQNIKFDIFKIIYIIIKTKSSKTQTSKLLEYKLIVKKYFMITHKTTKKCDR